jgi:RNA polymerase sigma-70 factor (ECF subfamily)
VYTLALRLSAAPAPAEDLCQEVFLAAWRGLAGFAGRSQFSTWLHRLTVNQWLMARRRGRLSLAEAVDPETTIAVASDLPARLDLERAMRRLPEQARAVFVLHDVEGHAHAEVGELLGIAPGTSKAHLHRARGLLKQWLESET